MINRYNSINAWLRERFGERVYKVAIEAGLGCPNRDGSTGLEGCTFCHPEALRPSTSKGKSGPPRPVSDQLHDGLEYLRARHGSALAISYLQNGSNTYAPVELLAPIYRTAIDHESVVGLAVSTRPDCIEKNHIELLGSISRQTLVWVEMGLQSAHDESLARIERGHSVSDFTETAAKLAEAGLPLCAHVILGLPGESRGMMLDTARYLNSIGVWGVKIHNLHVLKGTRLFEEYSRGDVEIPTLEEYAGLVVDFLEALSPSILIHRFNGHSPRSLTAAPKWSVNKLATLNAVHAELAARDSWQGKRFDSTG